MAENDAKRFSAKLSEIKTVGRYQVISNLGSTGSAAMFQAKDPYVGRQVALRITPILTPGSRDVFFTQVRSSGRLSHSNIVAVYDAGVRKEYCYIATEFVDGANLKAYCKPEDKLPITTAVEVIRQVCLALEYAHNHGVLHKDLRPANIMLAKGNEPKILDFGVTPIFESNTPTEEVSDPAYLAPEVIRGKIFDVQTDVYALGCILYELLCGKKAVSGDNLAATRYRAIHEVAEPVTTVNPDAPAIFDRILPKALAKEKAKRYDTCADFAYDLHLALRGMVADSPKKREKVRDVVDYVYTVPFFREFSKRHLKELISASELKQIEIGLPIVREGEVDDSFYIVLSGKADVSIDGDNIAEIGFGEVFGEMSYISGEPRGATVTAGANMAVMKIRGDLLDRAPATIKLLFFRKFAMALAQRLAETSHK